MEEYEVTLLLQFLFNPFFPKQYFVEKLWTLNILDFLNFTFGFESLILCPFIVHCLLPEQTFNNL